ncbi:MAG TPA: Crp/Fnr family transcriptional regulator [Telluria sp.]|nr:Crp/Fnr family transcriptional regulator [Telluria sp.]
MLESSITSRNSGLHLAAGGRPRCGNRLLAGLPREDFELVESYLDRVVADVGAVLYEPAQAIHAVYFPDDAVVSLLAVADGRMTLEVGLVGGEGVVGAIGGLGQEPGQVRALVQRQGVLWRLDLDHLDYVCARSSPLQQALQRYTDGLLAQAIQIALCSRFHVLEARLARSLLVTRDRVRSDKFHLTHENLAHALGVRRVGVTKAASALQQQGLINYSRGNIEILDPQGLETVSCGCYRKGLTT